MTQQIDETPNQDTTGFRHYTRGIDSLLDLPDDKIMPLGINMPAQAYVHVANGETLAYDYDTFTIPDLNPDFLYQLIITPEDPESLSSNIIARGHPFNGLLLNTIGPGPDGAAESQAFSGSAATEEYITVTLTYYHEDPFTTATGPEPYTIELRQLTTPTEEGPTEDGYVLYEDTSSGDDRVNLLGTENDRIYGQEGDDYITTDMGNDEIYGNQGIEFIFSGPGDDRLFGGQNGGEPTPDKNGNMKMQDGVETVSGGKGNDLIYGNFGDDVITGGTGNDTIFGGQGDDTLRSGVGDDTLWGGVGDDTLYGANGGTDTFYVDGGGVDNISHFDPENGDRFGSIFGFDSYDILELDDGNPRTSKDGIEIQYDRNDDSPDIHSVIIENVSASDFDDGWII
jgi:Ca2+-binding RTX toxin-like protein